jgi:hypothetical protein
LARRYPDLAVSLSGVDGLSGLLDWGARAGLAVGEIEIVTQDEYTHDAAPRRTASLGSRGVRDHEARRLSAAAAHRS